MQRILKFLAISLSIAAMMGADKDQKFAAKPPADYPTHVTQEKVTIAAVPYVNDDEIHIAFGKVNPNHFGVLPVLVVIQNDTGRALRVDAQSEFVDASGHHIEATSPNDTQYVGSNPKRKDTNIGMGSPIPLPRKKKSGGPLSGWEVAGRGFAVRMIPAGESASGFFYFQTRMQPGAKLYLTGLSDAGTGKELFYFEIPLEGK